MRLFCSVLLLCMASQVGAAARVFLVNVAPSPNPTAPARFTVAGNTLAELGYRDASGYLQLPAGSLLLSAENTATGSVSSRQFELVDGYDYTIALGPSGPGLGSESLHLMLDHNHPVLNGSTTFQSAHLSSAAGQVTFSTICRGAVVQKVQHGPDYKSVQRRFGYGTVTDQIGSSNLSGFSQLPASEIECTAAVGSAANVGEVAVTVAEGSVNRLFAIGDGINQPFDALVLQQEVRTPLDLLAPEPGLEGLWFSPASPGEGMALIWNNNGQKLEASYYGFEADGSARWFAATNSSPSAQDVSSRAEFAPRDFRQTVGFSGDLVLGTQALIPFRVVFHSCNSATAIMQTRPFGLTYNVQPFPQNALSLMQLVGRSQTCNAGENR